MVITAEVEVKERKVKFMQIRVARRAASYCVVD